MSIKERIRQLEDKVDRIERAVCGQTIEIKCPKYEVNIVNNDPEIIGNVMRWQGKDYLDADFVPGGSYKGTLTIADLENNTGKSWVPFEKVEITDALARMRTDDQPIWVMVWDMNYNHSRMGKLYGVNPKSKILPYVSSYIDYGDAQIAAWRYCRLANIDDLKKAGIR